MKRFISLFCLLLLAGCVSGSHLITGNARPKLVPEGVKVYQTAPLHAELIGTVLARSNGDDQYAMDRGVHELKRQAAMIGANALVLGTPRQTPATFFASPTIQFSAEAYYVP
jgi:hypothetical protein